jgi:hypothetical protein
MPVIIAASITRSSDSVPASAEPGACSSPTFTRSLPVLDEIAAADEAGNRYIGDADLDWNFARQYRRSKVS